MVRVGPSLLPDYLDFFPSPLFLFYPTFVAVMSGVYEPDLSPWHMD